MKYINEYNDYEQKLLDQGKAYYFTTNLIKDLEIKYDDKFPHSTFFVHKETGEVWREDNKRTEGLYVSSKHIWSEIKAEFPYDHQKNSDSLKYVMKIAFKMTVERPKHTWEQVRQRWRLISK